MSLTDYLLTAFLIFAVVRQVRPKRLSALQLAWPLALVVVAGLKYLRALPTAGNDILFVAVVVGLGLALGTACGITTRVTAAPDGPRAQAGPAAIVCWLLGVSGRAAFALYTENGGFRTVAAWSRAWHITAGSASADALLLMAFGEVLARTLVLAARARSVARMPLPA